MCSRTCPAKLAYRVVGFTRLSFAPGLDLERWMGDATSSRCLARGMPVSVRAVLRIGRTLSVLAKMDQRDSDPASRLEKPIGCDCGCPYCCQGYCLEGKVTLGSLKCVTSVSERSSQVLPSTRRPGATYSPSQASKFASLISAEYYIVCWTSKSQ